MKRALTLVLIAIDAAFLITGCSENIDSNPAAPSATESSKVQSSMIVENNVEAWEDARAGGFFPRVNVSYDPFACTATVFWLTDLPCNDNYMYYGNTADGLVYMAQAPDGGTAHTVTIDVTDLNLCWFLQLEGRHFANMPPITSDVMMKKRYPCIAKN